MKNIRFAFRMLKRNPLLVYVSIPGLAIGLCAFLLLGVYLKHEFSFNKHFPTKNRVVRLYNTLYQPDETRTLSIGLRDAYTQLPQRVPEIEKATQLYSFGNYKLKTDTKSVDQVFTVVADPEFFDVFGIRLLRGNKTEALKGKNKVVLDETTAKKIFGTIDCVGKSVVQEKQVFMVSGVTPDLPKTTTFAYNALVSFATLEDVDSWGSLEFQTYYLLKPNVDIKSVGNKIAAANLEIMKPWIGRVQVKVASGVEPISQIHLKTIVDDDMIPKTNMLHLYIVIGIAFFVLLIALINFMNMYLLHGEKRIAEIASRKSVGANRNILASQFFTETTIIAVLSIILALGCAVLAQPYFSKLINVKLTVGDMFNPLGIGMIICISVLLILFSGAYPSFYLSKINLVSGLKGKHQIGRSHKGLGRAAVLIQFFATVVLVSSLIIIRAQINRLKSVPLGFNQNNLVALVNFTNENKNLNAVKNELINLPFVQNAAVSGHFMGGGCSGQTIAELGHAENKWPINQYRVQPGFGETMQLKLAKGRFFTDSEKDKATIIVNEAAVKMMGLKDPIGAKMVMWEQPLEIIGVVKDFYFDGYPGTQINPLVLSNQPAQNVLYLRTTDKTLTADQKKLILSTIHKFDPEYALTMLSIQDRYKAKFNKDERIMKMVSTGALVAIILSFIGLLSLSIMNVRRRTKEIGVRKVMGSNETSILIKLINEMLVLVGIASVFGFGLSYILMTKWLSNFAIKIPLHIGYFLLSGVFVLVLALAAVSWQSWRAATRNPVEALRYE